MFNVKVSIITVCYNSGKTIKDTFDSIRNQTYKNIEYIVIDGGSTDNTKEIANQYKDIITKFISGPDKGLYDAMNKGIALASGDIVGTLNSDDILFNDTVIENIVNTIGNADGIYADVGFYDIELKNKTRHYSSKNFTKDRFSRGFMPAHPSLYVRKKIYDQAGLYSLNYKIASDFDMLIRIFNIPGTTYKYIPKEFVKMRVGGVSTAGFSANILLNKEIILSCRSHNIKCSWFSVLSKYPEKILGLLNK
ncbi:glycosyltransferase family 2 protein [Photobacterium phosphoreum]|uniref:glycosyltransferase family 2 protein n=1 Tax=Photobacterium phosphoreum TaxID=659 RepID=UPI0007F8D8B6|nr:glycosyltransferase family 2 protein [Photobacterium phosphoreum]OBU31410.1 glycosyl transferase [Photobacterium phosphoreum]